MSGRVAVKRLLALAAREEFVAAELVARALVQSTRTLLHDWVRIRNLPVTKIGRTRLLHATLVLDTYFPHRRDANLRQQATSPATPDAIDNSSV